MIPKIIHYCWFGKGQMPESAKKCIASWKKYCPDYNLVLWNEDSFDLNSNTYVRQAYDTKKYAFVTDYVRLYAMYNYGGIYMDTDVEVVSSLDPFLKHQAFSGFELPDYIPTGIMACEKNFPLFKEFLDYYDNKNFILSDGTLDQTTNVTIITDIVDRYGLKKDGKFQVINGFALYPKEYFCPLDNATGKLYKTKNTVTIHWFAKSWIDPKKVKRLKYTRMIRRIFGVKSIDYIKRFLHIK